MKTKKHNGIRCKGCEKVIVSIRGVHDFVTCECGKCSIDGGLEYTRMIGGDYDVVPGLASTKDGKVSWAMTVQSDPT